MIATLGNNDQVSETVGITIKLKITSQAANFIKQIFLSLAYSRSSIVKALNQTSLHMWQVVRFEVEILANVGGCRVDFCGQNIQKGITLSDLISIVNWMEGLTLLKWLRKFCNHSGPSARPQMYHQCTRATVMVCVVPGQEPVSQNAP
jgi:hypothetical protein